MPGIHQIAPGVFVAEDGASQSVEGRNLPASGIPLGPYSFRRKFRAGAGVSEIVNVADLVEFNGELIVPVGLTSVSVLPQPSSPRNCLGFRNSSGVACNLYIAFGNPATLSSWLLLVQNTIVLLDNRPPQDEVFAICDNAAGQLTIVQSIMPGSFS
jgi:hypothetical protein